MTTSSRQIREGCIVVGSLFNEPMRHDPTPAGARTILLTPNDQRVAEDRRDCYWLYVVTNCATDPTLQEPVQDPARLQWYEVTKVAHYYLSVNAMTWPMQVREDDVPYGKEEQ
jgi:hypothetical protein